MESQRVRFLIQGYLRGWLTFQYNNPYSRLREDIILYTLEQENYGDVLGAKLAMDSALVGGSSQRSAGMLNGLEGTYKLYLGLKLPDLATETTIKDTTAITKESINEWKALLQAAQLQQPKSN